MVPDLFRALGALCERPELEHARLAGALDLPGTADPQAYTEVFVLQLVPYASVYVGPDGMLGGEAGDRVAGFWRALHLTPPADADHLAALLGLYAALGDRERQEDDPARRPLWVESRRALLWEHLLSWIPPYTHAVTALGVPFYAAWARLLSRALLAEASKLSAPSIEPLHLRDTPALPDEQDRLVGAFLAPARSGLILTRADLVRCARETALGLRMGERSFTLRFLLDQDRPATYRWLAGEAASWAEWHRAAEPALGDMARRWRTRAEATLDVLALRLREAHGEDLRSQDADRR